MILSFIITGLRGLHIEVHTIKIDGKVQAAWSLLVLLYVKSRA
jgi:hypothetical protein